MVQLWNNLKSNKIFWSVVIALVLFGGGYLVGMRQEPSVQVIEKKIEDTETKQKLIEAQKLVTSLQSQLTIAQSQITDLKTHVKTVVRVVKTKDGTVTIDKVTESDTSKHVDEKKTTTETVNNTTVNTNTKVVDTVTKTHVESTVVTLPKDKYYLGLSATVGLKGIFDPGLEFKYRVLDFGRISGWAGTEIIVPAPDFKLQNIQGRLNLGVSF
jgi:hypothetical protein